MRFYTRQLYEQKQVLSHLMSFLNVIENREVSDDIKKYFQEKGTDYKTEMEHIFINNYKIFKPYLVKYLPETLENAIRCFAEYGKRPEKEILAEVEKYIIGIKESVNNCSDVNTGKSYTDYYKEIEKLLPEDIIYINKKYSFHDSRISGIEQIDKDKVIIRLDCKGSFLPGEKEAVLTFNNVKYAELCENYIGNWWIWDETHLSDIASFDFQVLLHNSNADDSISLNELRIAADGISLSFEK